MQLTLRTAWLLPVGGLLPAMEGADAPPIDLAGERPGELTIKLSGYHQEDRGGIAEVDETASVFEAVILAKKQLTDTGTLSVRLLGDLVSAASIERAHNAEFRAQQGGASGNYRAGIGAGWSEHGARIDWRVGGQIATEYAYFSTGLSGGATWHRPGSNTALSADVQIYRDTVELIRFNGENQGSDDRDTYTLDLGWHQVLSPADVLALDLTLAQQRGFLATSYNSVFPPSGEASEELPDNRVRTAITGRWRHSLSDISAAEIGARYYQDDWGVAAVTADLRYGRYLFDRSLLLEPTYRLHVQQAADDYRETWSDPLPEFRTSDPDLGDFTSHTIGVQATFLDAPWFGERGDWDIALYGSDRDNGLRAFWIILVRD